MIRLELLQQNPNAIPRLAKIWCEAFGQFWEPEVDAQEMEQYLQNQTNADHLPLTIVAYKENTPVGMCSLCENDGVRSDLTPWLASFVVDPAFQKQGIGTYLLIAAQQKAKNMGFEKLYLFTYDPAVIFFYEKGGWEKIGKDHIKGHPITLMKMEW